jgi:hypothetical protein
MIPRALTLIAALLALACGAELPSDVADYASREGCVRLNAELIPIYDGDPHKGQKNVYACDVPPATVMANTRPFPDGTLIVKESTRAGESFPWLIATARKQAGRWQWDEYTRNFADEPFRRILVGQSVCTDCHSRAKGADWIFTTFAR